MRNYGTKVLVTVLFISGQFLTLIDFARAANAVSNVAISNITGSSAVVTWNSTCDSTSEVSYGTSVDYGNTIEGTGNFTAHQKDLTSLLPGTTYHFRVKSVAASTTADCTAGESAASGDMTFKTSGTAPSQGISSTATSNNSSSKKKSKKKKLKIKNSKKTVKRGAVLKQSGSGFSKKSTIQLYFSKANGTFYPPQAIVTNKKGAFMVSFKVNKPVGKYKWYAYDVNKKKKSKVLSYKVK